MLTILSKMCLVCANTPMPTRIAMKCCLQSVTATSLSLTEGACRSTLITKSSLASNPRLTCHPRLLPPLGELRATLVAALSLFLTASQAKRLPSLKGRCSTQLRQQNRERRMTRACACPKSKGQQAQVAQATLPFHLREASM